MKNKIIITSALLITLVSFMLRNELRNEDTAVSFENAHASILPPLPHEEPAANNVSSDYLERVEQLRTYVESNPQDTTHLLRLARMYHDGHHPESAAFYYEKLLTLNPANRQVWLDLANCYAESMQWEKALETTEIMLKHFPGDGEALYNLGAVYANMGNRMKASEVWTNLLNRESRSDIHQLAELSLEKLKTGKP